MLIFDLEQMNKDDFDAMLEGSVSDIPPDGVVESVTPWKKASRRILIGIALCTVTLKLWGLDYILPAVGTVLMLLGFRSLRHENTWFGGCFAITLIRTAFLFAGLMLNATVMRRTLLNGAAASALTAANDLLLFGELFCLWRGFRAVRIEAGVPPKAGCAAALILWYGMACALAAVEYKGTAVAVAMLIGFAAILFNIHKLSKEIDEVGYSIQTAPFKVADGWIVSILALTLAVGGVSGWLLGSGYPMDWKAVDSAEHTQVREIKERLLKLGFPEYVLNDLSSEDIAACEYAVEVRSETEDVPANGGRQVIEYVSEGVHRINESVLYDDKELRFTCVSVRLQGDRESRIIFHHFLWMRNPGFYGTEVIRIFPAYSNDKLGWTSDGNVTGRVLYDLKGKSFAAEYFNDEYTAKAEEFLRERSNGECVPLAFSFPMQSENQRGYAAYRIYEGAVECLVNSTIFYTHQRTMLRYPAVTAVEQIASGEPSNGAFITVSSSFLFFPE